MKKFFSAFMLMAAMAFSVSTFVACNDVVGEIEDVKAQTTENAAAIQAIKGELANLDTRLAAAQKAADDAMAEAKDAKAAAAQAEANAIAYTKEQVEALLAKVTELEAVHAADVEAALALITNNKKELDDKISQLLTADEEINKKIDALQIYVDDFKNEMTAELAALETELNTAKAELAEAIEDVKETLGAEIDGLADRLTAVEATLEQHASMIDDLYAKYNTLDLRVQSLVYVPEYSDHKATLDWATVVSERGSMAYPTILAKSSDLKYLVKAENAVKVAESIAETPEVLDFVVKGVQTRGEAADLEIVDVVAEGEYIIVSVIAKNFVNDFYTNPEEGIYSAALVFDDETNTRTTEFTNLVPAEQGAEFVMALYVPELEKLATANEVISYKMVCNDSKTAKTAYCPEVVFLPVQQTEPASFFDVDYMINEFGYDVTIDTDITLVDTENEYNHDGTFDVKEGPIHIDQYFNIMGGNPVYDFTYTVKEGVSFDNVGKQSTVKYDLTCGNSVCTLTYAFVLSNAQVAVDMEVTDTWTVAKELNRANDYVLPGVAYTAVGGTVVNLNSILTGTTQDAFEIYEMVEGEWKATETLPFYVQGLDQAGKADIVLFGGKYGWNNTYKVVITTVNDKEHVDYTLTMVVNLVGMPAEINIPEVEVEFALEGGQPYFFASADTLYKVAFKEMQKYFGYEDAKSADNYWTNEWVSFTEQDLFYSSQKVNGAAALGITTFTKERVQAFLDVEKAMAGDITIKVDEPNVITFTANTCYGVPVNFTIKGNAVIPQVELLYSEDYVHFDAETPYVIAEGEIADRYNIVKSDLAKYFNVNGKTVSDHFYYVDFEVVSPVNEVVLSRTSANVYEKEGAATFHYLEAGSILDWAEYRGLEVAVKATLYVNGYKLGETMPLELVTIDPLTLTGSNISKERKHRENTYVNVYENLVLTSVIEPAKANLLDTSAATLTEASAYAQKIYGAEGEKIVEVVLGPRGVYYETEEGVVTINSNKYDYNATTGVLTIYGDDSVVKEYKADFTAVMKSRICARPDGSQEDAAYVAHNVHFQVSVVME